ncbi:AraC-type DNA-binding protein [Paenibacillus algorifonticola]|uniref:AraC-type DNA-binding protein n=1 Tax=Paenibacillus algorifonticola TaxID=684063 RepID=A0A1I2A6C3_9BACL|nr:helix-turn-helix domain-containing protein [Paenibacillus algorifonticola]SFE39337.1 AraC-type DNA-binding protein [Paenibacillus algorifonticola]
MAYQHDGQAAAFPPALMFSGLEYRLYDCRENEEQGRGRAFVWLTAYTLLAVTQGQGTITINGVSHLATYGKCFLLAPNTAIGVESEAFQPIRLYQLSFEIGAQDEELLADGGEMVFEPFTLLEDRLLSLRDEPSGGKLEALQRHIRFQQLMLEVLKRQHKEEDELDARRAVERTISFMQHSYKEEISIGRLAQEVNMSRWQYGEKFKALTGSTPTAYLTALRIERAKQLLMSQTSRIRDIAGRVGFGDEYYFSRRFKQMTGLTPTQYMQEFGRAPRIFSIQYIGELLALGIRPIAVNSAMFPVFEEEALRGVHGIEEPVDAEQIMRLSPDLILYPSFTPASLVDQLVKIAPMAHVSWHDDVYGRMRTMGELLGRPKEAEEWIAGYMEKAVLARERLGNCIRPGETASAFVYVDQTLYMYATHHFGHTLYQGGGFELPKRLKALTERNKQLKWMPIRLEELPDYAGDRVFFSLAHTGVDEQEGRAILNHPIWQILSRSWFLRRRLPDGCWRAVRKGELFLQKMVLGTSRGGND